MSLASVGGDDIDEEASASKSSVMQRRPALIFQHPPKSPTPAMSLQTESVSE